MTAAVDAGWATANRDLLMAELGVIRALLRAAAGAGATQVDDARLEAIAAREGLTGPSTLDDVATGFGLSAFERSVLLLVAGPELAAATADEIAAVGSDPRPTFGLALSVLPEPAWGALTPRSPLRRWGLVALADGSSPTRSPLVIDERVLHHLVGAGELDPELAAVARAATPPKTAVPSLRDAADAVAAAWARGRLVALAGPQPANLAPVAAAAARAIGRSLHVVAADDVPRPAADRDRFLRLMEREAVLGACAWAIDVEGARREDVGGLLRALPDLDAPAAVLGTGEDAAPGVAVRVALRRLAIPERRDVLGAALRRHVAPRAVPVAQAAAAATVFDLSVPDIELAAEDVARGHTLWASCRARARSRFGALAHVLEPGAG